MQNYKNIIAWASLLFFGGKEERFVKKQKFFKKNPLFFVIINAVIKRNGRFIYAFKIIFISPLWDKRSKG